MQDKTVQTVFEKIVNLAMQKILFLVFFFYLTILKSCFYSR